MKQLSITAFIFALFASMSTYAACIPHDVAEGEVSGKQYIMENSPNPDYPVILGFSSDNTAFLGSQLDGHPGGEYSYKGDCHGYIKLYFKSYFGENKDNV